jgi:hypothetical protein
VWRIPEREMRRRRAETLYELEALFAEAGWHSEEFVYDKEHDLYRFQDPEFTFSRKYANEWRLREMGRITASLSWWIRLTARPVVTCHQTTHCYGPTTRRAQIRAYNLK